MYDSKDYVKDIEKQTPRSNQELDVSDWSITDNKISFKTANSQKISDFWGIRR